MAFILPYRLLTLKLLFACLTLLFFPMEGWALKGMSAHAPPRLQDDFVSFSYVNPQAPKGGMVTIGMPGTFDSLNPFNVKVGSSVPYIGHLVFQSLLARHWDEPFALYPLVAQSYDWDDNHTHLTFHLNPHARFSDDHPLTSEDVRFSFELLKTKGRPQQRAALSQVKDVAILDPYTLTFDLGDGKDQELPLLLGLMTIFPRHLTDPVAFEQTSLSIPIGSGPYKLISVQPGSELIFEKNPHWWAENIPSTRGLYNFQTLRILYFRDMHTMFEAFKAGELDYFEEMEAARWLSGYDFPALRDGRVIREEVPIGRPKGLRGLVFNTRRPLFQDIRVREAFTYLFDFEWINAKLYGGLYQRTQSYFDQSDFASPHRPASVQERALLAHFPNVIREDFWQGTWSPPVSDGSGRDRTLARKALALFEQAGWILEKGKLTHMTTHEDFTFEIIVMDRSVERLCLLFAQSLARVGITAHVRLLDDVQYQRRRQSFDFDMTFADWPASPSPGNEQRGRWTSAAASQPSSFNLSGVAIPAIDDTIEALQAATTYEAYQTAVRVLDRLLLSRFLCIPLYHASHSWIAYSAKLAHPPRSAYFTPSPYGIMLETFWHKETP